MGLRAASLDPLVARRRVLLQNVESQRRAVQLSVGLQLSAAATGLRVPEARRARVAGLVGTAANASRAVNIAAAGEDAVREINAQIGEIRSLVVRAADQAVLANIGLQTFRQRIARIALRLQVIAETARFGGSALFDGTFNNQFEIGQGNVIGLTLPNLAPEQLGREIIDGIPSLAQVNLAINPERLDDALLVVDGAADEVARAGAVLDAFETDVIEAAIRTLDAEREEMAISTPPFQISSLSSSQIALSEILDQTNVLARAITNGLPGVILNLLA